MIKSRKQRLYRISRACDILWVALLDLRKHNDHTADFHQAAGAALNYLNALAKKAK